MSGTFLHQEVWQFFVYIAHLVFLRTKIRQVMAKSSESSAVYMEGTAIFKD